MSVCICSKIIKELPGLVGSGTPCIILLLHNGMASVKKKSSKVIGTTFFEILLARLKVKVVPIHAVKAYCSSRPIAPFIQH